jgi:hypothetical protein
MNENLSVANVCHTSLSVDQDSGFGGLEYLIPPSIIGFIQRNALYTWPYNITSLKGMLLDCRAEMSDGC